MCTRCSLDFAAIGAIVAIAAIAAIAVLPALCVYRVLVRFCCYRRYSRYSSYSSTAFSMCESSSTACTVFVQDGANLIGYPGRVLKPGKAFFVTG